jgi:hypothetical protein
LPEIFSLASKTRKVLHPEISELRLPHDAETWVFILITSYCPQHRPGFFTVPQTFQQLEETMLSRSILWKKWFRVSLVRAFSAALALLACPGYFPPPIIAQEGMRGRNEAGDMECISYCSPTQPGTVIMEIRIRLANQPLNEADLRAKIRQQGLEVTVYSEGFERGLYAVLPAIRPRAIFTARPDRTGAAVARSKIPGLEKLMITDVATRLDKPAKPFVLMQPDPLTSPKPASPEGEWVTVRLQGLDPGMAYTYRIPGGQSVVTCQAVVCPVDIIPAPANRSKPRPRTTH